MAWRCTGATNGDLVENMWRNGLITQPAVRQAFLKVDRANYAPTQPYDDSPQPIGHGATISAPHMHAAAVEALLDRVLPSESNPTPRVLDVGSGSGYLTHVLAELVGDGGGVVVGLEHISALRDLGEENMRRSEEGRRLLDEGKVGFRLGDGRLGWKRDGGQEEGWDAIHVGASAAVMHAELVAQLRAPGRMFIPVDDGPGVRGQHIWVVDKDADGKVSKKRMMAVLYVPLRDAPPG